MTCRARSPEGRIVCKTIQNTSLTSPDTNYYQIDQVRTLLVTFGPVYDPVSDKIPLIHVFSRFKRVQKQTGRTNGRTDEHTHTHTHDFGEGPHTISSSGNDFVMSDRKITTRDLSGFGTHCCLDQLLLITNEISNKLDTIISLLSKQSGHQV